uniref:Uncharacterized protein n=1 Tax=Anguilla anguilla TaxID=7936 RepID=A0A0E9VBB7_ANGAN
MQKEWALTERQPSL